MFPLLLWGPGANGGDGTGDVAGVEATSALGTASASGNAAAGVTGLEVTSALGTASATGNASGATTGLEVVSAPGTVAASGDALASVDGVEVTTALGDVAAYVAVSATADGVEAASALGTVAATGDATAGVAGVSATASVGAVRGVVPSVVTPHTVSGGGRPKRRPRQHVAFSPQERIENVEVVEPEIIRVDAIAFANGVEAVAASNTLHARGMAVASTEGAGSFADVGDVSARGALNFLEPDLMRWMDMVDDEELVGV